MINFSNFEKKIKVIFKDKKMLEQAFTHRSYINENSGLKISHNERLEFLGDAVLGIDRDRFSLSQISKIS